MTCGKADPPLSARLRPFAPEELPEGTPGPEEGALPSPKGSQGPCPGIELDDGSFSGCSGEGWDCPVCFGGLPNRLHPLVGQLFEGTPKEQGEAKSALLDALVAALRVTP